MPQDKNIGSEFKSSGANALALTPEQAQERENLIASKLEFFNELLDRGYADEADRYPLELEIDDIRKKNCLEWDQYVKDGYTTPAMDDEKARSEIESYIEAQKKKAKTTPHDPDYADKDHFSEKKERDGITHKLQHMSVGEWNDTKKLSYVLGDIFPSATIPQEPTPELDQKKSEAMNAFQEGQRTFILKAFSDNPLLGSHMFHMKRNQFTEAQRDDIIDEAFEKGYIDELQAHRCKKGEILQPSAPPPPSPEV